MTYTCVNLSVFFKVFLFREKRELNISSLRYFMKYEGVNLQVNLK